MRNVLGLALLPLLLAACTSGGGGRSTEDPRVRSLRGQVPPELAGDVMWSNSPPTSLAGLRGRVVYVQFAFPT
jgi:hypothetical protein